VTRITAALLMFGAAVVVAAEFVVIGLIPAMTMELRLSPVQAGSLITVFALASALLGPILVAATARLPTSPVLAAALLPFAANLLLLAIPSFPLAIALRVLQGATLPLFMSLAGALLGASRGTGSGIALLYVGVTIGGTLAPPAGNFMAAHLGWQAPMAAAGALALAAVAGCLTISGTGTDRADAPWRLLGRSALRRHLLLSTLAFAAMFTGFSYVGLLLRQAGFGEGGVTLALLAFGIAGLGGNWLAGKLASYALATTVASALIATTMALAIAAGMGPVVAGVAVLLWGAAHAAGFVFCQVRVMDAAPDAPGFAGSLNISAANLGIALGSLVGGKAIEFGGVANAATAGCVLALLAVGVAAMCRRGNASERSPFWKQNKPETAPE
jgi:predicted MFS family arabinose efflux permease